MIRLIQVTLGCNGLTQLASGRERTSRLQENYYPGNDLTHENRHFGSKFRENGRVIRVTTIVAGVIRNVTFFRRRDHRLLAEWGGSIFQRQSGPDSSPRLFRSTLNSRRISFELPEQVLPGFPRFRPPRNERPTRAHLNGSGSPAFPTLSIGKAYPIPCHIAQSSALVPYRSIRQYHSIRPLHRPCHRAQTSRET